METSADAQRIKRHINVLHKIYKKFGYKIGDYPNSEDYGNKALSIPIYPNLKKKEQLKVVSLLKKFFYDKK